MTNSIFLDDIVAVTAAISSEGQTLPKTITWRGKQHTVTAVGRQWETEDGRHILIEIAGSDRFELQLSRKELLWRLKRAWQVESLA